MLKLFLIKLGESGESKNNTDRHLNCSGGMQVTTGGDFGADPQENCQLNVKKLPKT